MLAQLFINNIAVIERASIDLEPGFTVLTGETGAGKSMIIDAIHAILGERTSKELVRTGETAASVSALFTGLAGDVLELLDSLSVPREEEGSLLVQRNIRLEGKSSCKLNGAPATVSMLKTIAPRLIGVHGQHESYELLSPELHMNYIDSFGQLESLLERYKASYQRLRGFQRRLKELNTDQRAAGWFQSWAGRRESWSGRRSLCPSWKRLPKSCGRRAICWRTGRAPCIAWRWILTRRLWTP